MITKGIKSYNTLIMSNLNKISKLNKYRKDFIVEVFILFMSIKGRINFLQLSRYGKYGEQRYRQQFEKQFDFLEFNKNITLSSGGGRYAIAFDPSYINKSGKHTPGVGYFWSGVAGQAKWGIEIGGIAAIDIENHTAFHLEAVQTLIEENKDLTLLDWYIKIITSRKEALSSISNIIVADAWFSKRKFVDAICSIDMHVISRLRDDADLMYIYQGNPTGKRGRPKKYIGKVDNNNIDKEYFDLVKQDDDSTIYSANVYSKSLKRTVKLVYVEFINSKNKMTRKLYFSTDLNISALDILEYYQSRFQIEFLYRDGKQHTGLNDCQARDENKLNFHFNASLTAINLAKVTHWLSISKEKRKNFSMQDVKTMNHNSLMLQIFFNKFGINPYLRKNKRKIDELLYYGTIAA